MPDAFDPYFSWLGIPPAQQPADYYRLLGINRFEGNQEVIANAAERQIRHIETFKTGLHAKEAEKLLNKLATAKVCLSDVGKKQVYDRAMSGAVAAEHSPQVASDAPKADSQNVATSRSQPRTRNPLVELTKIVLGGIAGIVIGMAILWYGFGMDVFGVMQPQRDVTANSAAEKKATVPESTSRSQTPPVAIEPTLDVGKKEAKPLAVQSALESHEVPSPPPPQNETNPGAAVDESTKNSVADGTLASTPVSFRDAVQKLLGTWEVTYTNRTRNRRTIGTDGPLTSANGDILIDFDTVIERLSLVGDKLFVEHFNPKSTYPKGFPYAIGIGKRIDVPVELLPIDADHDLAISSVEASSTVPARAVVPSVAVLATAEATVRSVFADEYVSSKTPAEKSELAAKLLQIGLDTTDDTASRFVTLRSARNVAVEGGHVDLAFHAVDAMNESFEMDTLAEQVRLAEDLAKASLNDEETTKIKHRVVELREQAFDRDLYPVAVSLNNLSRGLGKATDKQWRETTDRWTKWLEAGSAAFGLVQEALKTLESSPNDAAANLTIGRYRCLLKSEWQIGLPYLAKGNDEKLRAIAEREMASSDPTASETLALADSWWDLAAELDGI
ncbi:MAG: hypothetical protein HYV60_09260, partial [Planctomycetia bacterium]|nr:hypothetical protein [Planctomycetia bacterium]